VVEALLSADQNDYPKESLPQINYLKSKYFLRKNLPGKALESALWYQKKLLKSTKPNMWQQLLNMNW